MAVLSKIRQRSLLLIVVIGFCLLAFVVGDLINSGGFKQTSKYVGSINGEDISYEDFRAKVDAAEKSGQGTSIQAVNRVWEQEVSIALLQEQFEKLGIRVGENQIMDALKQSQDIGQNPQFLNAAGQFDVQKFKDFFQSTPELATSLKQRETQAALSAKYMIYSTMVKAGFVTTEADGKFQYKLEADKVSFDYVAVPYTAIKDSEVPVSDEEILAYMRKDEKKYKADESRELQFVVIEDKPSAADEAEVKKNIAALADSLKITSRNQQYVDANSDVKYDSTYIAKKDLPAEFADQLYNLPTGEVYGPYVFNGYYAVSKSLGRETGINAKASHILLAYKGAMRANPSVTRTKEEAQAKANELLAQATANPASFAMLAQTNSDDSSAQQGGDLGVFSKGQMTAKFNDFVFGNPIGKIGLVETEFGYHIINVTDKQDGVRLATIALRIEPSEETSDDIFAKANKFELEAADKDMTAVAKTMGFTVQPAAIVKALDENVGQYGNQRQIVRWAFDKKTDVDDVKRFNVPNGNLIVKLKKINKEGLTPISEARPLIESILKNEKKAVKIKAMLAGSTLEEAAKSAKVSVATATDLSLQAPNVPGLGFEPKVVGTAFATAPNKVSGIIEGKSGVYKIKTKTVVVAPKLPNYDMYVTKLKAQSASASGQIIPALKEDADIEDNRLDFGY
jgi:peptidyl-prolyl cis-trans isomerase D